MRHISREALEIPVTSKRINSQEIDEEGAASEGNKNADEEIAEIKEKLERQDFQKMVAMAEKDLENMQDENYHTLKTLFQGVRNKYNEALAADPEDELFRDPVLYKGEDIHCYG